jgi:hypothetical protein
LHIWNINLDKEALLYYVDRAKGTNPDKHHVRGVWLRPGDASCFTGQLRIREKHGVFKESPDMNLDMYGVEAARINCTIRGGVLSTFQKKVSFVVRVYVCVDVCVCVCV